MSELNRLQQKFENLIEELVDGVKDDLQEAEDNVEEIFSNIEGDFDQRALYGTLYHDALKIKGQVRSRALQVATLIKERISKIETDDFKKKKLDEDVDDVIVIDHKSIGDLIKTAKKSGELKMQKNEKINHDVEKNEYEETMEFFPKKNVDDDE